MSLKLTSLIELYKSLNLYLKLLELKMFTHIVVKDPEKLNSILEF